MENLITIFGYNLAAVIGLMICGWSISLIYKNVSVVDSLWGLGFVLIAWLTFGLADIHGHQYRRIYRRLFSGPR
jgi:steroid 5-alpha reductase family enzyme